jgi:glycosyltransferase involved in cell wall biosynthesis
MSSPKVSICIISYNHAAFLPTTIESALAQSYRDFEIVIVDDGSTDGSLAIAESYAAKHSAVKVFTHLNHINRGISATCNLVIEKARGEYLAWLGSDDAYFDYSIAEQVGFLEDHPENGMVCGIAQFIDENGKWLPQKFGEDIWSKPDFLDNMLWRNRVSAPTVMMRRRCHEEIGLYDENLVYSDWEMWLRLLLLSDWKIGFINKSLALYRVHGKNISLNKTSDVNYKRNLQVLLNIEQKVDQSEIAIDSSIYSSLKGFVATAILNLFYLSAEEGRMSEAARHLSDYVKRNPTDLLRPRRFVSVLYRTIQGCSRAIFPDRQVLTPQKN